MQTLWAGPKVNLGESLRIKSLIPMTLVQLHRTNPLTAVYICVHAHWCKSSNVVPHKLHKPVVCAV